MQFIITGGGTGGHIYPALAIANGLKERFPGCTVMYIGTKRGMEADIVPKTGLEFHAVRAVGIKRNLSWRNLMVPWEAWAGYREARRLIREFNPSAVVGTGGYVCGPVVLAASRLKIPTLIHEQNALPGVTNRILSRVVDRVAVSFEDSMTYFSSRVPVNLTGLPVRAEIIAAVRGQAREKFGVHQNELFVLSFGGSQGARTLNRAVVQSLRLLAGIPGVRLLHVTGNGQYEQFMDMLQTEGLEVNLLDNITVVPYMYEMPEAMAAADLVVSRAGAATLAEITVRGLPALLVPFPFATGNHQEYNARALVSRGAADMVLDADFTGSVLVKKIKQFLAEPNRLQEMSDASFRLGRPHALVDIINLIQDMI